ncbi:MAG: PKD domain-containing protein [Flavobacteriales bacterium]|nr:PKD domain-containing protein [Flavobacteriales bacterium]
MKAASPNTPVDVEVKNIGSSTFNVGTSWSRYTITGTKSGGWPQNYTSITFAVDGLVWIDAVQLEQGSAATPYEDDNYEPEYPSFKPTAVINGTYSGVVNTAIPFSSIGSSDIDGQIVSYSWDFGDGSTSIQSNPTHSYGAPGTYNVTLNVTDNEGNVGSNTTVAVIDPPTDIEDESIGDFTLFPVPARNELYVHSPMKEIVTYEILDAKANIVFADQLYFGQNKLDLSRFARGIYLLKTNEGVLEKFVIE